MAKIVSDDIIARIRDKQLASDVADAINQAIGTMAIPAEVEYIDDVLASNYGIEMRSAIVRSLKSIANSSALSSKKSDLTQITSTINGLSSGAEIRAQIISFIGIVNNYLSVYSITENLKNIISDSSNPTTICGSQILVTLKYTPVDGYELPVNITVTGAAYKWSKTGTLTLSNPTDDVIVTIVGATTTEYSITENLKNIISDSSNPSTIVRGGTATLEYSPASEYLLPSNITVTGAAYKWSKTGTLTLSNPTDDVIVTIVGATPTEYSITVNSSNVLADRANPKTASNYEPSALRFEAQSGYYFSKTSDWTNCTVVGCDYKAEISDDRMHLIIDLSDPTDDVTVTVTSREGTTHPIKYVTSGCSVVGYPYIGTGEEITATFIASSGYYFDSEWTGSNNSRAIVQWLVQSRSIARAKISNPTGSIILRATATEE